VAAPFQNYTGGTFLPDLVTRPEFLSYISEEIFERCAWIQSGVLVRNSALDCRAGGVRVRVPFFQPINPTEEKNRVQFHLGNQWCWLLDTAENHCGRADHDHHAQGFLLCSG